MYYIIWAQKFPAKNILIHCDNIISVLAINSCSAINSYCASVIKTNTLVDSKHFCVVKAVHIAWVT